MNNIGRLLNLNLWQTNMVWTRRHFVKTSAITSLGLALMPNAIAFGTGEKEYVMTVRGKIRPSEMGLSLTHEHVLVDMETGASGEFLWDREAVKKVVLPYLNEAKTHGCQAFFDFTPSYVGKDVRLLGELADATGLHIITNTGYYGANKNKHIPEHAYKESAQQLAARWIQDFREGMQGTKIKPGFIKTAVAKGPLSTFHQKLVKAAALTHLKTGLTIASHTGPGVPALQQIKLLRELGVSPTAFVWTHAQNEEDRSMHIQAASHGAWISLDGIRQKNVDDYVTMIENIKEQGYLNRILLSHDAGWYTPNEEKGGKFRGYTALFTHLMPKLEEAGFRRDDIDMLLVQNPSNAFTIRVRTI